MCFHLRLIGRVASRALRFLQTRAIFRKLGRFRYVVHRRVVQRYRYPRRRVKVRQHFRYLFFVEYVIHTASIQDTRKKVNIFYISGRKSCFLGQ